jgi:CobQ-like glutamine amidotransferase family enzyme
MIVAFENHSGKTYLGEGCAPLGKSVIGGGNNGEDGTEGAIYKRAYGCYLHGSLLPKNPRLADLLLSQALERRYGVVELAPLDDSLENLAHAGATERARLTH